MIAGCAAAVGAATASVAAGAAILPIAALAYGISKLSSTDYDSPSEMRKLRARGWRKKTKKTSRRILYLN